MAPRAIWKGHLEIGQLVCPVALHAAASTSERVAFHIVNRKTGHRVRRVFVDAETGEVVEREDQAKGYETDRGKTIVLEEEELAEAVPEGDKTLRVEAFIPCGEVDTLYFDRAYYLTPDGEAAETAFAVIRAGLAKRKAVAIARTVLFRRLRAVLIRAQGAGLVANTLEFDHEVRHAAKVFDDIPELKLDEEMLTSPATSSTPSAASSSRSASRIDTTTRWPRWSRRRPKARPSPSRSRPRPPSPST
jgi:DNA end-binding protein Ku